MPETAGQTNANKRHDGLLFAVIAGLAALFFLSFFNRFAGIRSGGGEWSGGIAFLAGRLPYRDYFTAGPPLNQIKSAIELGLFGHALIVTRACAVAERLLILALLFVWLKRLFRARAAAVGSLATIVLSAGDKVDPLASYNHDAILLGIVCGFFAGSSLDAGKRWRKFAVLAGIAAGLSSLTKQTVGLGVAVSVGIVGVVAAWQLFDRKRAALWSALYAGGFAFPLALMAFYLHRLGVLRACLQMLFVSGPAAKASEHGAFLRRELLVAVSQAGWVLLALLALGVGGRAIARGLQQEDAVERSEGGESALWLAVSGVAVMGVAWALAYTRLPVLRDASKGAVHFTLIGVTVFGLRALVHNLRKGAATRRTWEMLLLAAVGWAVAVTLSLSWPAFEAMLLPGLGLLVAAAIDGAQAAGRRLVLLVVAVAVFLQVREKLAVPFGFHHQDEAAVRFADRSSTLPLLRGMRLPAETVRLLEATDAAVRQNALPGDTVFTYPEFSPLYPLTGRNPPTWSGSHNIDVVPDDFVRAEAARLEQGCPVVIVYARPTESALRADEFVWRAGKASGQREMVAALDRMVGGYRLMDTFVLRSGDNPIRLYVRPGGGCGARGTR